MKKLLAAAVLAWTLISTPAMAQPANVGVSMCSDPFGTHTGTLVLAQARITHMGTPTLYFWYGVHDSTDGNVYLSGSSVTPACGDTYEVSYSFYDAGDSTWTSWSLTHVKENPCPNPMGPGMVCDNSSAFLVRNLVECPDDYPNSGTGTTSGYYSGGTLIPPPPAPGSTPPTVDCGVGSFPLPTGVINPSC